MNTFTEIGLQQKLLKAVENLGYKKPTPIQAEAIPHLLNTEEDLMALAQTGTGKTAAFGLPSLQKLDTRAKVPQILILSPTRELALQITEDMKQFSKYMDNVKIVPVYGGASIEKQKNALKNGAQVVVATPGRARDLLERGILKVDNIQILVLDEADEMLTMGFQEELNAILEQTPKEKQTLLFSATMSKDIEKVARKYMRNPVKIAVATENQGAETVEHIYYTVPSRKRYEALKRIADLHPDIYGIVFCRTRRETKEVAAQLMNDGYNADALHGDLSQAQRDEVMRKFRKKHIQLLVATDVAARGIDVDNLTHIINYNLPDQTEYYTHRSGRTGRAGRTGTSIALIHPGEKNRIKEIERTSKIKFRRKKLPSGKEICSVQLKHLADKILNSSVDEEQIAPFLQDILPKFEELSKEEIIKRFLSLEFNRLLNYYKNAEEIEIRPGKPLNGTKRRRTRFTRLFLNVGKKEDLTPKRLIGILNNALDSNEVKLGKIEILNSFSFLEVESGFAEEVVQAISSRKIKGRPISAEISSQTFRRKRKNKYSGKSAR